MFKRFLFLSVVLTLPTLQVLSQESGQKKQTEVILLHANDMHAKIDNMAKLAYLADSLRRHHPNVFLVSAGDNFTGNPVVDMVPDKGAPMIDLMNRCGFSASAVGNHEFDMGQELLRRKFAQAGFPFICANLDGSAAVMGPVRPYLVLGIGGGDSIALLGLIQLDDNNLPSAIPSHMTGVQFVNGIEKARQYEWLKKRYGNMIALSHLGIADDARLADSVPLFDLVIGGHSHTLLEKPRLENGVMIVQAGSNLKYIGKTTLVLENGKVTDRRYELVSFETLKKENPGIRKVIDAYNNNPEFDITVGTAARPVEGLDEMGSLMTDALTHLLQIDFAFQNKGGIRLLSLPKGDITLRDIYKLDPFSNQVVLYSMTAEEIKSLICYGYQHEKGIDLQVSGMTYKVTDDGTRQCAAVEMFDKAGKPLDPKAEYSVAMNSYMSYTYQFNHRDPGTMTAYTTTEALIKYLRQKKTVNYSGVKRATVKKSPLKSLFKGK
jgi:2',3'-cyclic-nucleotide 2'-phosphodiesterase (5'-nucleotidase family)